MRQRTQGGIACKSLLERRSMETTGLMFPKGDRKKKKIIHHPKSIMHPKEDRTCFLCMLLEGNNKKHYWLHEHHIFGGNPNRTHSEEAGLKVYLCQEHHLHGKFAVHNNNDINVILHKMGQRAYEANHTRQQFIELFGENYLD